MRGLTFLKLNSAFNWAYKIESIFYAILEGGKPSENKTWGFITLLLLCSFLLLHFLLILLKNPYSV